jgi:hypothetical protein
LKPIEQAVLIARFLDPLKVGAKQLEKRVPVWRYPHQSRDLHDLRGRVIGQPEISADGFHPYRVAIRDAFGDSASHGVIVKTYSVTHPAKDAVTRYSPAAVVAVSREVVSGDPEQYVSTSYVERQNLSLSMGQRRFIRLTNGFSKKLDNHVAAVARCMSRITVCAGPMKPSTEPPLLFMSSLPVMLAD